MASIYSTNLKIELMTTGENSGSWGTVTNSNFANVFEQAIVGRGNPNFSTDADLTLTYTNTVASQTARNLFLDVTSSVSLTVTRSLIVPTIYKNYIVANNTTGGQSITVKTAAGTGITIPNGRKAALYVDNTNVVVATDWVDINGGSIDGTPIGASSASTGAFSAATVNGIDVVTTTATQTLSNKNLSTPTAIVLTNGTGLPLSTGVTGNLPVTNLNSGTSASGSTFWRGDGTWASVPVSGGTVSSVSVVSANGLAGTVANATTTPALTLSTTITGILKGNGTAISAATAGTDYFVPGAALSATTGVFSGVVTFSAGTLSLPAITTTGDTNTGIYFPAADTTAFTQGGTERLRISSSGNVGLGVTPSAWTSSRAIEIIAGATYRGAISGSTGGNNEIVISGNAYETTGGWLYTVTGAASRYYQTSSASQFWQRAISGTAGNPITWSTSMYLDGGTGSLGLGTTSIATYGDQTLNSVIYNTTSAGVFVANDLGTGVFKTNAGLISVGSKTNSPLVFVVNNTETVRVTTAGGVAFGGSTNYGTTGQVLRSTGNNTPAWQDFPLAIDTTLSGAQNSIGVSGIPSYVKNIKIVVRNLGTDGTEAPKIRLATSGGTVITGYTGSVAGFAVSSIATAATATSGFSLRTTWAAANTYTGTIDINKVDGTYWVASWQFASTNTATAASGSGQVDIGAALNGVFIEVDTGNLDAGTTINIYYS
jgi:hypothetical protein